MDKLGTFTHFTRKNGLSSDFITGFCTETEEDHQETLSLMEHCKFDFSYMYFYSERPGTLAAKRYEDDVTLEIKKRRLQEIVDLQGKLSRESNKKDIGKSFKLLIEGESKKSNTDWMGRTDHNKVIVFPKENFNLQKGDYAIVHVSASTQATLLGNFEAYVKN